MAKSQKLLPPLKRHLKKAPFPSPAKKPRKPPMDHATTLADLREWMREFVAERHWEKFHTPRNLAASVAVEAGELLELFQWLTPEEALQRSRDDAEFRQAISEELSDVLMYLMSLANAVELDVAKAVHQKMIKNRGKYPAQEVQGHYQRPLKNELR